MRKIEFAVPSQVMAEFAQEVTSRGLDNTVNGTDEDGDILFEVFYEKEDAKLIDQLEEMLEKMREQIEEEEDGDEDDEETEEE